MIARMSRAAIMQLASSTEVEQHITANAVVRIIPETSVTKNLALRTPVITVVIVTLTPMGLENVYA